MIKKNVFQSNSDSQYNNTTYSLNLDAYHQDESAEEFLYLLSHVLSTYKHKGLIALDNVDIDNARLIILSAWHAGWTVAIFPENMLQDHKQRMLKKLNLDILISATHCDDYPASHTQYIHLFIENTKHSASNSQTFLFWLEEKSSFINLNENNKQSYIWKEKQTALFLFTSGSTGIPKGVRLSLHSLIRSTKNFVKHFSITENESLLNTAALHTIAGIRYSIILPLITHCKVNVPKEAINLKNIIQLLEKYQPSILITGPMLIQLLAILGEKISTIPLPLRLILSGGSELQNRYKRVVYKNTNIPIINMYGMTETLATVFTDSLNSYSPYNKKGGKPLAETTLKIIDKNNVEHNNGEGELRVYSDHLYLGYLGEAATFPKFFDSNDQVKIDSSGHITWLYRLNNCIKGNTGNWIHAHLVDTWVRKQNTVKDVHIKVLMDNTFHYFRVEISGIPTTKWEEWHIINHQALIKELGKDYHCIQWIWASEIIRSSQGKYEHSVYS